MYYGEFRLDSTFKYLAGPSTGNSVLLRCSTRKYSCGRTAYDIIQYEYVTLRAQTKVREVPRRLLCRILIHCEPSADGHAEQFCSASKYSIFSVCVGSRSVYHSGLWTAKERTFGRSPSWRTLAAPRRQTPRGFRFLVRTRTLSRSQTRSVHRLSLSLSP